MATEHPQSPCRCCEDQIISLCGLPICASVSIIWLDDATDREDVTGQAVEGLTCMSLWGGGISVQYDNGRWVGYAEDGGFDSQRSQLPDVTNPLDPTGDYELYVRDDDPRPTFGTMTVTKVDCPPA